VTNSGNIEGMFGDSIAWGPWESTVLPLVNLALLGLKEGRLLAPVEVSITSSGDDDLLHCRLKGWQPNAMVILQSCEAKWHNPDIYPVTVEVSDASGKSEVWEIDPRPKRLH